MANRISRRTLLRGAGAALALPLMETMGRAQDAKPPVRLGFMYMPHGVIMEQFWPSDPTTYKTRPPRILKPLQPLLDQCLIVKGVSGVPISPFNGGPHALELSTWLTATLPDADRRDIVKIAISADQIAANYIGAGTPLPSLELATMPQTHKENQEGLNETYYSHCSYRSPTQPVPAETDPRRVLARLFQGGGAGPGVAADGLDRSLQDVVLQGARDLRGRLSRADQAKLDEYLDGIRALERRIAALETRRAETAPRSAVVPPVIPAGEKRSEYMKVMCDLTVLAFQADITRVSTYIGSTPNGVSYPELGFPDQHHSQTHHNNKPEMVEKVAAINAFNVEQFAYMVKRMAAIREGEGTLLDNCIMMWGSGLEDGNKHTRANLPFVLAGRGGGALKTGRFVQVQGNQGDLLGTLLTCAGIPLDKPIGIGTKLLPELRA
ncbi:MAG TPA: DUF1552 domain-containing protein [Planctomycetota bacterium]|nr:DUF1552 domain-containing protein [Planctomycetota bacterium]